MDYENKVKELENLVYKMAELLHAYDDGFCDLIQENCDGECISCMSRYFKEN